MIRTWSLLALMVLSCSEILAQDAYYVDPYQTYAPVAVYQSPVVMAPSRVVVPMSYAPRYPVVYAAPVVNPAFVQPAPVVVQPVYLRRAVVASPVAVRETARATRNGVDYRYREHGPLGAQRYQYSVNSRPHGYVVRERGR